MATRPEISISAKHLKNSAWERFNVIKLKILRCSIFALLHKCKDVFALQYCIE